MTIDTIIPTPDVFSARRILCIQPHYDDNDIAAAGTLARLAQGGAEIHYLTVTDDLKGVLDPSLSAETAAEVLKREQFAAGGIVGVAEHTWLGYPDAGPYDPLAVRGDLLKWIRLLQPDFIFAPDPWLSYEAHPDHVQTGLAAAQAILFSGLPRISSSDPEVDASYNGHPILGVAFYFTREPNEIVDVASSWSAKLSAVQCYKSQFTPEGMAELVMALDMKAHQAAAATDFERGEALKILHPSALHCGI